MAGVDDHTFFFMHIMKTAGTSFAHELDANFAPSEIYPRPGSARHMDEYWKVAEVEALDAKARRGVRLFHGHFPFMVGDLVGADVIVTLVRDPVERTISHLRHCERHFAQHRGKPLEAIYDDSWHHPLLFQDYQVKQFALTAEDRPRAHNEVIEIDETRLALATDNLSEVAVLGLTERYEEFASEVADRFGWTVGRRRRLQASPERAAVDPALRARIAADNVMDQAFYDQAVALYERRRAPGSAGT